MGNFSKSEVYQLELEMASPLKASVYPEILEELEE